jgi:tetratricopeptide (TPR) repeat protein
MAHLAAFYVNWYPSRATPAAQQALLAAQHARNARDEGLRSRALAFYVTTLMHGPQPAAAINEQLDTIERENPGPYLSAKVAHARSLVALLAGDFLEARRLVNRAIATYLSLGMRLTAAFFHVDIAEIERAEGNPRAALKQLLQADDAYAAAGEHAYRATIQAMLARMHELLGDRDAARAAIALSDELGATQDVLNCAITHAVRGRLALADEDTEAAERWARSAVDHASRTDFTAYHAAAQLELASILSTLKRRQDAASEARAALALYQTKGDRPGVARTQALLETLAGHS